MSQKFRADLTKTTRKNHISALNIYGSLYRDHFHCKIIPNICTFKRAQKHMA